MPILFGLVFMQNNRDCPENFTLNPQYPATEPECFPNDFVYYSSVNLAFYIFNLVTINDFPISEEDWVGAFNGVVCVGARQWGACNNSACDVPVFGDDGTLFTEGYMNSGEMPTFKIYDTSENIYIDAIPTDDVVEWQYMNSPIIELLYSYADIQGCTDLYACNFDPYANINVGSCEYCSCSLSSDIIFSNDIDNNGVIDNFNAYANNGSITARVFHGDDEIGSNGDAVAAYVNDEIRGIGLAAEVPEELGGGYAFSMMIYSNELSGEILTFKYYQSITDNVFCLNESYEFQADMIIGDAVSSFNLVIPNDWLDADLSFPESFMINSAYPNPFNPYVNIEYSIIEPSNIEFYFYSLSGKLVDEIDIGFLSKGEYSISWEPKNKASGIYFVVMSNGIDKNMTRITLLK